MSRGNKFWTWYQRRFHDEQDEEEEHDEEEEQDDDNKSRKPKDPIPLSEQIKSLSDRMEFGNNW